MAASRLITEVLDAWPHLGRRVQTSGYNPDFPGTYSVFTVRFSPNGPAVEWIWLPDRCSAVTDDISPLLWSTQLWDDYPPWSFGYALPQGC